MKEKEGSKERSEERKKMEEWDGGDKEEGSVERREGCGREGL